MKQEHEWLGDLIRPVWGRVNDANRRIEEARRAIEEAERDLLHARPQQKALVQMAASLGYTREDLDAHCSAQPGQDSGRMLSQVGLMAEVARVIFAAGRPLTVDTVMDRLRDEGYALPKRQTLQAYLSRSPFLVSAGRGLYWVTDERELG